MGPKFNDYPYRKAVWRHSHRHALRGRLCEERLEWRRHKTEETPSRPATTRSWKRQAESIPRACRGNMAPLTPQFWTSGFYNQLWDNKFLFFMAASLWSFVAAALGNEYNSLSYSAFTDDSAVQRDSISSKDLYVAEPGFKLKWPDCNPCSFPHILLLHENC